MFTGIVQQQAKILGKDGGRFTIENPFREELKLGQSIAHDGACMTIESFDKDSYTFFTMEESLEKTNFATKDVGDTFNIECCLRLGDRIDGHFVTGHIDTVGKVSLLERKKDNSLIVGIEFEPSFSKYIIEK